MLLQLVVVYCDWNKGFILSVTHTGYELEVDQWIRDWEKSEAEYQIRISGLQTTTSQVESMRTELNVEEIRRFDFGETGALYKEEMVIGNGAYGTVYKARDSNDTYVALKKVRIPLSEDGVPVSILREIALVRQLDKFHHPNIVRFLDVCHGPRNSDTSLVLFLVFEYVERDLANFMKSEDGQLLTDEKVQDITFQILTGVDFLHSQRIIHRDLKPQNLLISRAGRVKLADFGLAKIYDFTMRLTTVVVTLWYRSPELLLSSTYSTPVDIWSIGCIIAELILGRPLFPGNSENDQLEKILDFFGTLDLEWSDDYHLQLDSFKPRLGRDLRMLVPRLSAMGYDLLNKILVFNPTKRLSAREALAHPYFDGVRTYCLEECPLKQGTSF